MGQNHGQLRSDDVVWSSSLGDSTSRSPRCTDLLAIGAKSAILNCFVVSVITISLMFSDSNKVSP